MTSNPTSAGCRHRRWPRWPCCRRPPGERGIQPLILERGTSVGARCWSGGMSGCSRHGSTISTMRRGNSWMPTAGPCHCRTSADRKGDRRGLPSAALPPSQRLLGGLRLGASVTAIARQGHRQGLLRGPRPRAVRGPLLRRRRRARRLGPGGARRVRHLDAAQPDRRRRAARPRRAIHRPDRPMAFPTSPAAGAATITGKRVLVVGGGHSAINVALALMELQDERSRDRNLLGAPPPRRGKPARRRPERPTARAGRARTRRQDGRLRTAA